VRDGDDERARHVTISEAAEGVADPMLTPKVRFHVLLIEGDVVYLSAWFPLAARPSPRDFRIPFSLYARVARHALAQRDEGDAQYETRGGRVYDYNGNMLTDPPRPRRTRSADPRRDVDLEEVARIYRSAERAPTQTVARTMHLTQRSAERRVADARAAGLIDPWRSRERSAAR
jgi:hypothetical protein